MASSISIHLVHGAWGQWEEWENCAVTCGGGQQSRARACNDPEPVRGGNNCTDDGSSSWEIQSCNEFACQGMMSIKS